MDATALAALHATLKAGAPAGGRGGLGAGKAHRRVEAADADAVPKSALYARFVPAGSWCAEDDQLGVDFSGTRQKFDERGEVVAEPPRKRARAPSADAAAAAASGEAAAPAAAAAAAPAAAATLAAACADAGSAAAAAALKAAILAALADGPSSRRSMGRHAVALARAGNHRKSLLKSLLPRVLIALALEGRIRFDDDGDAHLAE
jgi:hypothetical protein